MTKSCSPQIIALKTVKVGFKRVVCPFLDIFDNANNLQGQPPQTVDFYFATWYYLHNKTENIQTSDLIIKNKKLIVCNFLDFFFSFQVLLLFKTTKSCSPRLLEYKGRLKGVIFPFIDIFASPNNLEGQPKNY